MIGSQNSYNRLSSLIVNEDVFNAVVSEIKNNDGSRIPQSVIIIGEEGSGKTTLLKRLYESCDGKQVIWIDGRNIFSTSDIIDSGNITHDSIIFIDNMDYYFSRCSYEEQYRLRKRLYNEGAPMMIATISRVLSAIYEYEAPFFEGLKTIYVNPISKNDVAFVFEPHYIQRANELLELLPSTIKSLIIVDSIIRLAKVSNEDRDMLLQLFSDKYRSIYQSQPVYSQHILNALGSENSGMKIPEIRKLTRLKTSILTAYLRSLKKNAIINIDYSVRKNAIYSIKDSLFRLWLREA